MVKWKWPTTNIVSCRYRSIEMSARNSPVRPPTPKTNTVASAKSMGVSNRIDARHNVITQFRTINIDGALMSSVKSMNPSPSSGLIPVMNMW